MKEVEPQEKPAKKKRRLAPVLFGLLFLVGFGILAYPTISNQWNFIFGFGYLQLYFECTLGI